MELLLTLIPAIVAVIAALFALFRWIGRVDANTRATDRLTTAFQEFTETVGARLSDHEIRITLLERSEK